MERGFLSCKINILQCKKITKKDFIKSLKYSLPVKIIKNLTNDMKIAYAILRDRLNLSIKK